MTPADIIRDRLDALDLRTQQLREHLAYIEGQAEAHRAALDVLHGYTPRPTPEPAPPGTLTVCPYIGCTYRPDPTDPTDIEDHLTGHHALRLDEAAARARAAEAL